MIIVADCIRFLMMCLNFTTLNVFNFVLMTIVVLLYKLLKDWGNDDIFTLHIQLLFNFILCVVGSTEDNLK